MFISKEEHLTTKYNSLNTTVSYENKSTGTTFSPQRTSAATPSYCSFPDTVLPMEITTFVLWGFHLYFFVSAIIYAYKQSRIKRRMSGDEKYVNKFNVLFVVTLIPILLRLCLNLETLWDHEWCDYRAVKIIKYGLSGSTLSFLYFILWLRQKIFYSNKFLASASNKCTKFMSWGSLGMLAVSVIVNTVFFLGMDPQPMSALDCIYSRGAIEYSGITWIKWLTLLGSMGMMQVTLLFLFAFPLYQQHRVTNATQTSRRQTLYMRLIKNVTITTVGCILSDTAVTCIVLSVKTINHDIIDFIYDISLLTNYHMLVWAFGDYASRMLWYRAPRKKITEHSTQHPVSITGVSKGSLD